MVKRLGLVAAMAIALLALNVSGLSSNAAAAKLAGFSVSGGNWTDNQGVFNASDLAATGNLVNQYVSEHNPFLNASLLTVKIRINALPTTGNYTIGLVDHAAANGNGEYKWSLDFTRKGLELLNDGFQVVSDIAYTPPLHQWITMELLASSNVLDGKVWTGSQTPKDWQISGSFFPGLAISQPDAGLYAAHASVDFEDFRIERLQTSVTAAPTVPVGMFADGTPIDYRLTTNNSSRQAESLRLVGQVVDANDHRWTVERTFSVAPGHRASVKVSLPVKSLGWYGVQYNLVNVRSGQVIESLPQIGLAVDPKPLNPGSTRLGMNISVVSWYLPAAVRSQDIATEFATLHEQGIQTVRLEIDTNLISNWGIYDPMLIAANQYRMNVLGILDSWPTRDDPFDKADHISFTAAVQDYVVQVKKIVERYQPGGLLDQQHGLSKSLGITDWEIWNEPSIPSRWGGSMTQYGELVKATATAVRSVEPDAFLLEYAHDDQTVYRASGDVFNGLAIHYYPGAAPPENAKFPITNAVEHNLSFLKAEKLPPTLWMTEVGWNTQLVSPTLQAEYLVRASLESLSAGSGPVYLFIQNYLNSGMGDQQLNFTPKPAYSAVLTEARMIRGYVPDLWWSHGSYQGLVWSSNSGYRLMVWNDSSGETNREEPRITGLNKVNWMDDSLSGTVLSISGSPLYLTAPKDPTALAELHAWFQSL